MNKRGWHTPKGLILIGIIAVTLIANYINFFDNSITGNIIRTSDTEIKLEINNQINFNEKIITLLTVNQKNILISVDEIKKEIRLGETEIVNGLLIKPIETDPREVFGGARFLVRDGTLNNQNSEQSSGIFKFHFDEAGKWSLHDHLNPNIKMVIEVTSSEEKNSQMTTIKKTYRLFLEIYRIRK